MFRKYLFYAFLIGFAFKAFALTPLVEEMKECQGCDGKKPFQEWIVRYFATVDDNSDFDEVVDALMGYKLSLQAKGYIIPPLYVMLRHTEDMLRSKGVQIDQEMFQFLEEELFEREDELHQITPARYLDNEKPNIQLVKRSSKDKKDKKAKKEKWEFHFTKKGVFGLIKCIGGGLCTLVPSGIAQAVGAGLIVEGIKDILDDQRDSKSSEEVAEERARIDRAIESGGCP